MQVLTSGIVLSSVWSSYQLSVIWNCLWKSSMAMTAQWATILTIYSEKSTSLISLNIELEQCAFACHQLTITWKPYTGLSKASDLKTVWSLQYRDLSPDSQLALTVWERAEGHAERALGGASVGMFSKKGRLKTGRQLLRVWLGEPGDLSPDSETPGKQPVPLRGEAGSDDHLFLSFFLSVFLSFFLSFFLSSFLPLLDLSSFFFLQSFSSSFYFIRHSRSCNVLHWGPNKWDDIYGSSM